MIYVTVKKYFLLIKLQVDSMCAVPKDYKQSHLSQNE